MPIIKVSCSQCNANLLRRDFPSLKKIANHFCDNSCKGMWQRAQREAMGFNKQWLEEQYFVLNKSANQIAREIGRDSKRVWEWIREYGLETRKRGTNYGQHFKKGMIGTMTGKKHSPETKAKLKELSIADGRVPWGKGNEPYWKGKTGEKHPSYKGGLTPERQSCYSSQEWVEAVKTVWHRDNATCQRCGVHHNTEEQRGNFHIHHIVSFQVRESRTEPSNLILLCKPCHKWVHSKKNVNKELLQFPLNINQPNSNQLDLLTDL